MKVYKPGGAALERIANYRKIDMSTAEPVSIGTLRYAASIRNFDSTEGVPIYVTAENFLAQRTALFGMTRTGKSNTTKTIASAVFKLRLSEKRERVGQLILDPNGEYANDNPQDQGCLRNLANLDDSVKSDVVTYGLQPHPNDPERKITKFNFFGNPLPGGVNPNKQELDETLQSLYQGKQIIDAALSEESGGYIQSFVNADIRAPSDVSASGVNTRYRRALFVYKSVLSAAGLERPDNAILTKGLFGKEIRDVMQSSVEMKPYVEYLGEKDHMPWDMAQNFCRDFSGWVYSDKFKDFDRNYNRDRNWSDDRLLGLLRIFENTRGLTVIQGTRQWHALSAATDYAIDIINHIRKGRLVIFDQALGDPTMNEQASERIMKGIFTAQQQAFINPKRNPDSGEIEKPEPVLIYVEEAHTLLPEGRETDTGNIWARIAKEGS